MKTLVMTLCYFFVTVFSWAQDGSNDLSFNSGLTNLGDGPSREVRFVTQQPDGKLIITGDFVSYDGLDRNRIARLNPDGKPDTNFNPGTGLSGQKFQGTNVFTAVQPDGKIILAGDFTFYNDVVKNNIARINADGSLDASFNSGSGTNEIIGSMALLPNGKIIISGPSSFYNGTPINRIARLNSNGSLDTSFAPGIGASVSIIIPLPDEKLLVIGSFTSYNGTPMNRIARLNPNGSLDTTFNTGTGANNSIFTASLQPDGKIIVGGDFTSYSGTSLNRVARLNSDGSLDTSFNPGTGANNRVRTSTIQSDGKIIISGTFTLVNSVSRIQIARLHSDGSLDAGFNPIFGSNTVVFTTIVQSDGKLIIGGFLNSLNGTSRNHLARLNDNGSLDATFNQSTGAGAPVETVAVQPDGKIIIGGDFSFYNGTSINRIARLNVDGSLDTGFNPGTGANADGSVKTAVIQPDGKIIIGGGFSAFNGTARNGIARINPNGTLDSNFNPGTGVNGWIRIAILLPDGKILIGGSFTSYNGTGVNRIARLNANGSLDTGFNPGVGPNGGVHTIALQPDGKIIIGGAFTSYSGRARNNIARLNSDGSLDTSFNPGIGANRVVHTIALQSDGKIIIGGEFTSFNGTSINRIARLNGNGSLDTGFDPGTGLIDGFVFTSILQPDEKLLIGGNFRTYNGTRTNRIARLNPDGSLDSEFYPGTGANREILSMILQPDDKILIGGDFTGYDNVSRVRINRLLNSTEPKKDEEVPVPDKETLAAFQAQCIVNFANLTIPTATDNVDGTVQGTTDVGIFPITTQGSTIITWTYTDAAGNSSTQTQEILIADTEKPIIAIPNNIIQPTNAGSCEAALSIALPTVTDNCNTGIIATGVRSDGLPLNEPFALGITTITWTAVDGAGNQADEVKQNISVIDEEKPIIEGVSPFVQSSDVGSCRAILNITPPLVSDNCDNPVATGTRSDGLELSEVFPVGVTIITWSAKDASGNEADAKTQMVTVTDEEDPKIVSLPSDIEKFNDPGLCGALVNWTAPTVTDTCGGSTITQTSGLTNGSVFPVGTTTVTYTATDASGNAHSESFKVTVNDNEKPEIGGLPSDMLVKTDLGLCGVTVNWTAPTATDNCGGSTIAQSSGLTNGSVFPVGTNTITYTATDVSGNTKSGSFTITVTNDEKPSIIGLPDNILKNNDPGLCGAVVSWTLPTSSDSCGGSTITQTAGPLNGSFFPVGTTLVTYTAIDDSGNSYSETFTVRVIDNQAPTVLVKNYSLQLDNTGNATLSVSDINNGSSDNCSTASELIYELSKSAFTISDVGVNMVTLTVIDAVGNSNSANVTVTVLTPKNLSPENLDFIIFPNPAISETNILVNLIEEATVTISLYDASGKLLIKNETFRAGSFMETFLLDGLAPGLYNIQLQVGNTSKTKRLIKL